jgi:hypothetical protein
MPRYKVFGSVDYCKPTEGYIEVVVEAADPGAARRAALDRSFSPAQRARYNINAELETEETEEPPAPEPWQYEERV